MKFGERGGVDWDPPYQQTNLTRDEYDSQAFRKNALDMHAVGRQWKGGTLMTKKTGRVFDEKGGSGKGPTAFGTN